MGSTRTPTWSPLTPLVLMEADAAIAIGLVLIVPDPCTEVLWGAEVVGHPGPLQLGPSTAVLLWYGDSFS